MPRKETRVCEVCGITSEETRVNFREKFNMVLCNRHDTQMRLYGKILEITTFDKNDYIIYDDYAEIILRNRKCKEVARTIIDLEDVEKCKLYKWRLTIGYVKSGNSQKESLKQLHRYVLNITDRNIKVDHIDRDKLNNRKSNLRICTQQENMCNQGIKINNVSGVSGVNWVERDKSWRAYITYNKKQIHLGYHKIKDNAIKARLEAEAKYFKEFAPQQHLFEEYGIINSY